MSPPFPTIVSLPVAPSFEAVSPPTTATIAMRRQQTEAETGAKQEALERMELLRGEMLRVMEVLHSVQALFEVKPEVTRAEFRRFVGSALTRLPELQALEWIPRVTAEQRPVFEQAARADGFPGFCFTEINAEGVIVPAGARPDYSPVFYAEPVRTNAPALGLDLAADPRRREALERAARTGLPSATRPLRLAQAQGDCLGFLVVAPVGGAQEQLLGFALAGFQMGGLVADIFAPLVRRGVRVEIRDLDEPENVLYAAGPAEMAAPTWRYAQDLPLAGRVWRFRFSPGESFRLADPDWLRRAAETLQRTNEILEDHVAERTEQLDALNRALKSEVEVRKRAEDFAAAANRAKSLFLAEMSHEIRTPLNIILGYTQLLQRDRALATTHSEAVGAIVEGGNHLLCLVDGVLDLTKIETGRMELAPVDFELTTLVKGLAAMFGPRCQQKGLKLRLESLGHRPIWVHGDERKLRQVLVNLLGNAVKFTDAGEVRLRVVPVGAAGTYRFEVIDTGPGIPLDVQATIFEPFRQEAEGKAKGGTGLGLSIARRLIELLGGSLAVNSAPGWGSNFFFALSFPAARTAISPLAAAPFAEVRLAPGCRVRAFVADDHPVCRTILARMLSALGCEVLTVEGGNEALTLAVKEPPHIVFMDIRMPGLDGIATARAIHATLAGRAPRLVAYSASAFEHERDEIEAADFDDCLPKPFRFERITECLTRLLGVAFVSTKARPPGEAAAEADGDAASVDVGALELPEGLVAGLRAAAEIGDFAELRKGLAALQDLGPGPGAFAERLRRPAERFDTEAVLALLAELPAGMV